MRPAAPLARAEPAAPPATAPPTPPASPPRVPPAGAWPGEQLYLSPGLELYSTWPMTPPRALPAAPPARLPIRPPGMAPATRVRLKKYMGRKEEKKKNTNRKMNRSNFEQIDRQTYQQKDIDLKTKLIYFGGNCYHIAVTD